jgi:uncharacterized protein (TIGR00369 family)
MRYRVKKKQPNSKMCLVCGLKNSSGLKSSFYELENDELLAVFKPAAEHQGYPGRLHGGITMAILDETIGRSIMIKYPEGIWGVTAELNIRLKKPVPLDKEVRVIARVVKDSSRHFEGSGEILLPGGEIAAKASGKYFKFPIEKIAAADADFSLEEQEWKVVPADHDPREVEI